MKSIWAIASLALSSCATVPDPSPADQWVGRLSSLCGRAFEGRLVSTDAADASFAGQKLMMHVRQCSEREIRIPFHVGDDRSRTWVLTRTAEGLRLKHDHRHEDGSADRLTQYGGDTTGPGSAGRQLFPADDFSKNLFERENSAQSVTNVWAMEVEPGRFLAYELRRPGRFFRVEFDLAKPVAPPPPPWGP